MVDRITRLAPHWTEICFEWYKFRHALADAFSKGLQTNRGKKQKISFAIRAPAVVVKNLLQVLESYQVPGLAKGGNNKLARVLRETAITSAVVPKRVLEYTVEDPSVLNGVVGESANICHFARGADACLLSWRVMLLCTCHRF